MAKIKFNQTKKTQNTSNNKPWKIIIADDEMAVHELTKTVLGRLSIKIDI